MGKNVIVVSGPPGAGSSTIAKVLARKLKLRYLSIGKIQKSFGISEKEGKSSLEVWRKRYGRTKEFHLKKLDEPQIKEAEKGNVVINGKLSIHFLKDMTNKKIWIDVPLEIRAERSAQRDKISVVQAVKEIKEREAIERREFKRLYSFDYFDQKKDADLVIDSSNLTVTQTASKILYFIRRKTFNS